MNAKNLIKIVVIANILCFAGYKGQQNIVLSNDLFSGISSVASSPSHTFLNPNPWDVQLFSEDISVFNDHAYISQQRLLGLPNATIETANPKKGILGTSQANVLDFYNKDFSTAFVSSEVMGPSFSIKTRINEKAFNIGLFTRLRTQVSVVAFDNYLRFQNQNIDRPAEYFLKPINTSFMNWGEVGLNVSTQIFEQSDYKWHIGFNLKYEAGFDAYNLQNLDDLKLINKVDVDGKSKVSAEEYNIQASYATNYNFQQKKYNFKQQGKGFGIDFGLSFINQNDDEEAYDFIMSLNLLDVGYVNFDGANHRFIGNKIIDLEQNPAFENKKFDDPEEFLRTLSQEVYGNPNTSKVSTGFRIGLPTSLHFSMSKNISKNKYVSLNWIQRTPIFENTLQRINAITASYSVQKNAIGYGFSTSLYEYRNLQFGAYLRLGPLILGSDNLFPMFFKHKQLHSANFFIGLKLYPFWDNVFKRHRRQKCNC